jgi:hypothetical protein
MENMNLLDLDNDILNIIGDYVKNDNYDRMARLKQDIFDYVDIEMKIERKEARKGKYYISRRDTRDLIWVHLITFCRNRFGTEYLTDIDKYAEIHIIYNDI